MYKIPVVKYVMFTKVDSKLAFTHRLLVKYPSGNVFYHGAEGMVFNTWAGQFEYCR